MRSVTAEMVEDLFSQNASEKAILITLTADGLEAPITVCNHEGGLTRVEAGQPVEYPFFPFYFTWPGTAEDKQIKEAKIEIANVGQEIIRAIRAATGKPRMTLELVKLSNIDVPEVMLNFAKVQEASTTGASVEATLQPKSYATELACSKRYTAFRTPGLF